MWGMPGSGIWRSFRGSGGLAARDEARVLGLFEPSYPGDPEHVSCAFYARNENSRGRQIVIFVVVVVIRKRDRVHSHDFVDVCGAHGTPHGAV